MTTARFAVRLTPRGGSDRVTEVVDGLLTARVAAAPVDGAANAALIRLLAETLGLAKGRIRLVGGESNRRKLIEVDGLDPADLRARWPGLDV